MRKTYIAAAAGVSAIAFAMPTAAFAQAAADADTAGLEEIVVTAQRRGENLQSVPIAVSAFSTDSLKQSSIDGLTDLAAVTPSLTFTYQAATPAPFLRGVGNNASFPGAEAEVQTYIDGVYYASQTQGFMKFNNIERVEVIKGPQGTLFGRNATGGVIQIITRRPSHEPRADISIGYGSRNLKEGDFYGSVGVGAGLATDLAVHYEDRDGWGKNIATGEDVFKGRSFAIRNKWLWEASDTTEVTLAVDYGRDRSDMGAAYARSDNSFFRPPNAATATGPMGYYTVALDAPAFNKVRQGGASLKLESQLGSLGFVSISSYRKTKQHSELNSDFVPQPYNASSVRQSEKVITQEFQLLSPKDGDSPLQWIVGSYFFYNKAKLEPLSIFGTRFAAFGASRIDNFSTEITHSYAGYGQATYDVTDRLHLTGGLRYTKDYRKQSGRVIFQYPTGPGAPPAFLRITGVNRFPKADFDAFTGKVSAAYDFADDIMGYASYNRGFKSGIFNNYIILSDPLPALDPQYIDAYEVGLKTTLLDGKLRFNTSLFRYDYSDLQVQTYTPNGVGLTNAANARIWGGEVDMEARLTPTTRVQGGFVILDAKYQSFVNAPSYIVNPITNPQPAGGFGGFGGVIIGVGDASGNRMPFAAKFSGNMSVYQDIPLSSGKITVGGTMKYQSTIFFTPDNRYKQKGYALASGSARWIPEGGRFEVGVWGRNLTGKKAWAMKGPAGAGVASTPIEPRTVGVRLTAHLN